MCGFRPTGRLHVGHYFSVIKPGQEGADVLIANYHAPEVKNLDEIRETLHRFGVKNTILQKDVFDAQRYFDLLNLAGIGDLSRMTQYKAADEDDRTGQLLTYPVLMAHDVAGYKLVLVGEDQRQHLEFARRLLRRYNRLCNQDLNIPAFSVVVQRIMDLEKPDRKMSKSSPDGCLFLDDSADDIRAKLRKATTTVDGRLSLEYLYKGFVGSEFPEQNLIMKETLSEAIIEEFKKYG